MLSTGDPMQWGKPDLGYVCQNGNGDAVHRGVPMAQTY
jgi:hypothetical protein